MYLKLLRFEVFVSCMLKSFESFLLSSDIRSEEVGPIAIVKKFDFFFFLISILYQSHILKK